MQGIDFIVDDKGQKKAAIVDLKKYGNHFKDFIDGIVATDRREEKKSDLSVVRKRLLKKE